MNRTARTYIGVVSALGALAWTYALSMPPGTGWLRFTVLLILAVLLSNLKVSLPGIQGTMSINYIVTMFAIITASLPQAVAIQVAGTMAQTFAASRLRPRPIQLAFNFLSAPLFGVPSYLAFHAPPLPIIGTSLAAHLFYASMVYFLTNTICMSGVIALTEGKQWLRTWRDNLYWTSPHYLLGAGLAGLVHHLNQQVGWQYSLLVAPSAYLIFRSYRLYLGKLEEEKQHVAEVADLHLRTIEALALAIDAKEASTRDHVRRVQIYTKAIAEEMGLSEDVKKALEAAALLHDIGKLAVPEYILSKPGKLTAEEYERVKIHPIVGAEILSLVNFPYPVVPIVRGHHERWDGKGYPDGLKGTSIPVGARILSVVDTFDAMISERQYRPSIPVAQAIVEIRKLAGTAFDPEVVEILARRHGELEERARTAPLRTAELSISGVSSARDADSASGTSAAESDSDDAPARVGDFITSIAAARQEFQMLHEVTRDLGNSLSVEDTCSLVAAKLRDMVPHHAMVIYTIEDQRLVPAHVRGENQSTFGELSIPIGEGISGWVAQTGSPYLNGNPSVEFGYLGDPTKFSNLRSALAVPLKGLGGCVAVLTLYHRGNQAFTKDHQRILEAVGSKVGMTLENALRFHQARSSADTDALTGLPNAKALFRRLDQDLTRCKRETGGLAVIVIDLDGFKQVNDRFGHLRGNVLLKEVAARFRASCRETDFVARMGGDEFVILMPNVSGPPLDERIAHLGALVVEAGVAACGEEVTYLSAGVAYYPHDGEDAERLLDAADRRMYRQKERNHKARGIPPRPVPVPEESMTNLEALLNLSAHSGSRDSASSDSGAPSSERTL